MVGVIVAMLVGCRRTESETVATLPLQARAPVNLGVVSSGGQVSQIVKLVITSSRHQELVEVKAGCRCVEVKPLVMMVPPLGYVYAEVNVNMMALPRYEGDLLVDAYGFDGCGRPVLRLRIAAEVVPATELKVSMRRQ